MVFQEDFEWQSQSNPNFKGIQELNDSEIGLISYTTEIVRKLYSGLGLNLSKFQQTGTVLDFGAGIGFLAGFLASALAVAVGWGLARYVFDFTWTASWSVLLFGSLAGAALALAAGWWGLRVVLTTPVVETLRKSS